MLRRSRTKLQAKLTESCFWLVCLDKLRLLRCKLCLDEELLLLRECELLAARCVVCWTVTNSDEST